MKTNSAIFKIIILLNFILFSINSYGNNNINLNEEFIFVNDNKIIDSIKLETKYGYIKIENECDSKLSYTYFYGTLYDSLLKKTLEESEKLHIDFDEGTLIFELNNIGQLIECKLGKAAKLKEFNILLQKFATEINLKYKDKIIMNCNDSKNNTNFEIPIHIEML